MSTLEQAIRATPPPGGVAPQSELDRALAARDYERAAQLLAAAIERQPKSRELLLQIASVFMMDRKPLNAAIALKKAEVLGPLDNHARLQLALAYIAMKRGDWARPELERLALAEPANRADLAEAAFQKAIRRDATLADVHLSLARIYLADGRLDEAARAVARALALVPDSKEARALQASVEAARTPRQPRSH